MIFSQECFNQPLDLTTPEVRKEGKQYDIGKNPALGEQEFNLEEDDTPREFQTEESKKQEEIKTKKYFSVDTI